MKAEPLHLKDEMKGKHLNANAAKGQSLLTYQYPAEAGGRPESMSPCAWAAGSYTMICIYLQDIAAVL